MELPILALGIAAGLYMSWNIGANDVANGMASAVGAKAITLRQAVVAGGLLLTMSGAYYTLDAQTKENKKEIKEVKGRTVADSNRIRDIKEKAAAAAVEREFIQREVRFQAEVPASTMMAASVERDGSIGLTSRQRQGS